MLLAGDIGGTKTNLALYSSREELHAPRYEATFPSANYSTLADLVQDFLGRFAVPVERAVFGVAGPVLGGKAKVTNLPWVMEEEQLQQALRIPAVHLLNDLVAMAEAVPAMEASDLYTLSPGKPVARGPVAVIAPGTGLGEAFLAWDGARYRTLPSEGGHADFAPTNAFEIGLLVYMLERLPHVSYEHVCSGIGLPHIYAYMKSSGFLEEPAWLTERLTKVTDITPLIVEGAMQKSDPAALCAATVRAFVSILGAEAGNMAIKLLTTGGVYIGGGIPPRILPYLEGENFKRAFINKGRFSNLLADIPVHVILNPKIALVGAASYGFQFQSRI